MGILGVQGRSRVPPMLPWSTFLKPAHPLFDCVRTLAVIKGYQGAPTVKMVCNLENDTLGEG